jgi:hypothetical protein
MRLEKFRQFHDIVGLVPSLQRALPSNAAMVLSPVNRFLFWFAVADSEAFCLPELDALLELNGVDPEAAYCRL